MFRRLSLSMYPGSIDFVFRIKIVCGFHTTKVKKISEKFFVLNMNPNDKGAEGGLFGAN